MLTSPTYLRIIRYTILDYKMPLSYSVNLTSEEWESVKMILDLHLAPSTGGTHISSLKNKKDIQQLTEDFELQDEQIEIIPVVQKVLKKIDKKRK